MRIYIDDFAGHAFPAELAESLARRGHQVALAYCSTNSTPHGDLERLNDIDGSELLAIGTTSAFEKYSMVGRVRDEVCYGARSRAAQRQWKPDVTLSANMPVLSQVVGHSLTRRRNVLWLQDLQSDIASLIVTGPKRHLLRLYRAMERLTIRRADHVVAIAESLAREAEALGLAGDAGTVIENWAPIGALPRVPKDNAWAAEHGLADKFVFLYSGTMGMKHRPELVLELARQFEARHDVQIVVTSESAGADWLRATVDAEPQPNLTLLPYQPFDQLPAMLATADVLLVVLEQEAGSASIPSKVLSYLCAGRPILGFLPPDNSATKMVVDRAEAGIDASTDIGFLSAAEKLYAAPELRQAMGDNGRAFAEATFDIETITDRFETILLSGR